MRSKLFYAGLAGVMLGVWFGEFGWDVKVLAVLVLGLSVLISLRDYRKMTTLFLVLGIGASLGFFRSEMTQHSPTPKTVDFYNGEELTLEGYITNLPQKKISRVTTDFMVTESFRGEEALHATGLVRLTLPRYPEREAGVFLKVYCELLTPQESEDFSYKNYLARYEIYSLCNYPGNVEIETRDLGLLQNGERIFKQKVYEAKEIFTAQMNKVFPEPTAGFLRGVVLGEQSGVTDRMSEEFRKTGLTHLLVVSGMQITIVVTMLGMLFGWAPKRARLVIFVVGIVVFTVAVGASSSVVRAALMGGVGALAMAEHRQKSSLRLLALVAGFMILITPKVLVYDVGFQLSCLATLGIILLEKEIEKWLKFVPRLGVVNLRGNLAVTLAAQVCAIPLLVFYFQELSVISPLANVLVVPLVPWIMLGAVVATGMSFVSVLAAKVVGVFAWGLSGLVFGIVEILEKPSWACLEMGQVAVWIVVVYYVGLGWVVWRLKKRQGVSEAK